jgi:hypothetical protein
MRLFVKCSISRKGLLTSSILSICIIATAQKKKPDRLAKDLLDSAFISEMQYKKTPIKVLHAEPLYIDLIRDLGARKGEKEWNVGWGIIDKKKYVEYETLVEYEWAPINRLGLEVELPFSFYSASETNTNLPQNKLHSIKLAAQYSFFVSEQSKTSLAIGYIHEFEITPFSNYGKGTFFSGNIYNPFFIVAKRWGQNFHTLIYTGPQYEVERGNKSSHLNWQINTNLHYMIDGTRNFIGIECNKNIQDNQLDLTLRPQMRLAITDNLLIGIVSGLNLKKQAERFSFFFRLIYEPSH